MTNREPAGGELSSTRGGITRPETVGTRLALEASRLAATGEYEEAIELQLRAVEVSREILERLGANETSDHDITSAAARSLADHHGRLGGICRRAGLLSQAIEHYNAGANLERTWNLDIMYNRTNSLFVSILLRPERLPEFASQIDEVAERIRQQVLRNSRNEWWAWADLALMNLLNGRPEDALWAYQQFAKTGPMRRDYDSVLSILLDVKIALARVQCERSTNLVELAASAIKYVRGQRDESSRQ